MSPCLIDTIYVCMWLAACSAHARCITTLVDCPRPPSSDQRCPSLDGGVASGRMLTAVALSVAETVCTDCKQVRGLLPACLPTYLPALLPALLRACLPARLPACLPARPPACLPACPPACPPACLPARLPACTHNACAWYRHCVIRALTMPARSQSWTGPLSWQRKLAPAMLALLRVRTAGGQAAAQPSGAPQDAANLRCRCGCGSSCGVALALPSTAQLNCLGVGAVHAGGPLALNRAAAAVVDAQANSTRHVGVKVQKMFQDMTAGCTEMMNALGVGTGAGMLFPQKCIGRAFGASIRRQLCCIERVPATLPATTCAQQRCCRAAMRDHMPPLPTVLRKQAAPPT